MLNRLPGMVTLCWMSSIPALAQDAVLGDSIVGCVWTQFTFENGEVSSEGCLVGGLPEGEWITYHVNGQVASRGSRKNGLLEGKWFFHNEEGWLEHEISYDQGTLNGEELFYSSENQLLSKFTWLNGVQEGWSFWFDAQGNVVKKVPFEAGKEMGLGWEYDPSDGRPIARLDYHNGYLRGIERINRYNEAGRKRGVWLVWNAREVLIEEGPWTDGQRNGVFTFYDNQGKLDRLERYINGQLQEDDETTQMLDIRRTYHENGQVARIGGYGAKGPEGVFRIYDDQGNLAGGEVFKDGQKVAEGKTLVDGFREGEWKLFYASGELFGQGSYVDGLRDGIWQFYNRDGTLAQEGSYRAGEFHGNWIWYYPDGSLHRKEAYRKGEEDGLFQEWNLDGELLLEGDYVEGEKQGFWFSQINDHKEEGVYIDGMRDGEWTHWYDNGQKQFRGSYLLGDPIGRHLEWNRDGTRRWLGEYEAGLANGDWIYYSDNNQIMQVRTFKIGVLVKVDGVKVNKP
jgi:antitoxin component YwqK of YwqJK toxin-antitoxin module